MGKFIAGRGTRKVITASTDKGFTTYDPRTRSYSGPGRKPKGATVRQVPTVITTSDAQSGDISTTVTPAVGTRGISKAKRQRLVRRANQRVLVSRQRSRARSASPPARPPHITPPPQTKVAKYEGKPTAGTPTFHQLEHADLGGKLKTNKAGAVVTPKVAKASQNLTKAKKLVKRSNAKAMAGLSPEERDAAKYAKRAHRNHPAVPTSVLMSDQRQESNFDADAVSSADAFGRSQFIPTTAAEYGVLPGHSKKAKASQAEGQAAYLEDLGFKQDPQGALSGYSGGYAAGDYNNPVLEGAADYKGLDKPTLKPGQKRLVKRARKEAKAVGLPLKKGAVKAGEAVASVKDLPKKVVTRYKAALKAAKQLGKAGFPYSWGGGHDAAFSPGGEGENGGPGYDCSGAVSYVLHKMGVLKSPLSSGDMGSVLKPGPGAVTVYYNGEHTFMYLAGYGFWGTSVGDSGAGGIGKHPNPSKAYLSQYSVGHVPGLDAKVAAAFGGLPPASLPGITMSADGTTATVDPQAATTQSKPGFSKRPIKLNLAQQTRRQARMRQMTGPLATTRAATKAAKVQPEQVLADLEKQYANAT